jgi:hypothetical protein
MKSNKVSTIHVSLVAGAVIAALSSLSLSAHAAENRAQRYTPGLGGTDMTTMLVPGWYGQLAMIHYHATKLKDQNGDSPTLTSGSVSADLVAGAAAQAAAGAVLKSGGSALAAQTVAGNALVAVKGQLAGTGLGYQTTVDGFRADAYVALPRVTYISGTQFLGAHVGFTAMLPIVRRQTALSGVTTFTDRSAAINAGLLQASGGNTALASGATAAATFTPTLIVPTGKYDKNSAVNSGFGKFYTFRPSFQYGFIGDGWDVGARMVLSFNTKNKDTNYKSGTMFNVDFAAMKFVTEDVRLGLQGYVVNQLTKDSSDDANVQAAIDAADGAKMRAYAAGPALGWIVNGGEMVVEGKLLKEFGARNRSEGTTYMLMLSKPFGL